MELLPKEHLAVRLITMVAVAAVVSTAEAVGVMAVDVEGTEVEEGTEAVDVEGTEVEEGTVVDTISRVGMGAIKPLSFLSTKP